jgi:hypothetical protein
MSGRGTRLTVERVDSLLRRPSVVFVTGRLEGEPLHIGDSVTINDDAAGATSAEIRSIEMHTAPGTVTIALDADLKPLIRGGVVISRSA